MQTLKLAVGCWLLGVFRVSVASACVSSLRSRPCLVLLSGGVAWRWHEGGQSQVWLAVHGKGVFCGC